MERDYVDHLLGQWGRERPELDCSPMAIVGRISRLAGLLQAELEPVFAASGLTGGDFDVLAALRRAGEPYQLTPTALCRSLMISTGGMTKRLDRLERAQLLRRTPDPTDRRGTLVGLTDEGRGLVDEVVETHRANEDRLLSGLDPKQREQLAELLRALALGLGDTAPR